jgi:hypothetical protein
MMARNTFRNRPGSPGAATKARNDTSTPEY